MTEKSLSQQREPHEWSIATGPCRSVPTLGNACRAPVVRAGLRSCRDMAPLCRACTAVVCGSNSGSTSCRARTSALSTQVMSCVLPGLSRSGLQVVRENWFVASRPRAGSDHARCRAHSASVVHAAVCAVHLSCVLPCAECFCRSHAGVDRARGCASRPPLAVVTHC